MLQSASHVKQASREEIRPGWQHRTWEATPLVWYVSSSSDTKQSYFGSGDDMLILLELRKR